MAVKKKKTLPSSPPPSTKKSKTTSSASSSSTSSSSTSSSSLPNNSLSTIPNSHILHPTLEPLKQTLKATYATAKPYKHGLIPSLLNTGILEQVLTELKTNLKATFKESDLFKFYQTIDVGNLTVSSNPELCANMPTLMTMKHCLYSSQFRRYMEDVTGLPPKTLTDVVDCAVNCHTKGCHLLCHDDVIGTRCISFIIYLTDPSPVWKEEDGGCLELYPNLSHDRSTSNSNSNSTSGDDDNGDDDTIYNKTNPSPHPTTKILPTFNTMAYFAVTPNSSFHSVQEVFCDRPRMSIQGWYHAKDEPIDKEFASLKSLKSVGEGEDTDGVFCTDFGNSHGEEEEEEKNDATATATATELSKHDYDYLQAYINPTYLTAESITQIRQKFEEDSSVQLRSFLLSSLSDTIKEHVRRQDDEDMLGSDLVPKSYAVGEQREGWRVVGPAHKQRFLEYVHPDSDSASSDFDASKTKTTVVLNDEEFFGPLLNQIRTTLFLSQPMRRYLSLLTSLPPSTGHRSKIRRFRPGLDYTVAHYGVLTRTAVVDATLCFCAGDGSQVLYDDETGDLLGSGHDETWASGDAGGFECYIAAEEEDEEGRAVAVDEYDGEDDTELLSVSAAFNSLSLVYRDPGTMRFVKYLGVGAPGSRFDLGVEYEMEAGSDDDDDEDEEEDEEEDDDDDDSSSEEEIGPK